MSDDTNVHTERFIFLDIDGPLIPDACFFIDRNASFKRVFSPTALYAVRYLAEHTGALIVTNSSHNYHVNEFTDLDLRGDLIAHGMPAEFFHENWRTKYGNSRCNNRLDAVEQWLNANMKQPDCKWVAFDDDGYHLKSAPGFIEIDYSEGILPKHIKRAFEYFGVPFSIIY